ncbi:hypothetical protein [Paenibacillus xylanivorans]|uniref:Uncharacterized protein n=1 Tax=Paenibacillus xylanivorans TaxID=1705561 RepID=A0A0M9BJB2_9BACL|nr:hypothetical protein [Paenibacillus xylanivorans]KOY12596.1 hypothetical protein AMS66_29745 [Paenibacillus xylanivorans]
MAQTTVVQIGYVRDHRTGNFIVSLVNPAIKSNLRRQEIIVLPGAFFRILPNLDRRSIANNANVTMEQAADLGFIVSNFPTFVEAIA